MKKVKKVMSALMVAVMLFASDAVYSLPHDNRSDVDSAVKIFIPYTDFSIINDLSLGVNTPAVIQVNALGFAGIRMTSTSSDIHALIPIPDNACVSCPINFSVLWSTSSTTTTQTATWSVLYNRTALGGAFAAATTALNTVIAADAVNSTAYGMNETAQGVISAGTLSRGDVLHLLAELDQTSGLNPSASTTFFHGIYLEYTREQL